MDSKLKYYINIRCLLEREKAEITGILAIPLFIPIMLIMKDFSAGLFNPWIDMIPDIGTIDKYGYSRLANQINKPTKK